MQSRIIHGMQIAAPAFLAGWMLLPGPGPLAPPQLDAERFPVGIVDRLRAIGVGGNVLNSWNWAGYLVWAGGGLRVFVDPRRADEVYPIELFEDWERMINGRDNWRALLDRYPIDLVIVAVPATVLLICGLVLVAHLRSGRQNPVP